MKKYQNEKKIHPNILNGIFNYNLYDVADYYLLQRKRLRR